MESIHIYFLLQNFIISYKILYKHHTNITSLHTAYQINAKEKKIDQLCKSLKVKLVFTSEKLRCAFSTEDPYQSEHLSKFVYKFVCASCNASYVGQTCQHLATRID